MTYTPEMTGNFHNNLSYGSVFDFFSVFFHIIIV